MCVSPGYPQASRVSGKFFTARRCFNPRKWHFRTRHPSATPRGCALPAARRGSPLSLSLSPRGHGRAAAFRRSAPRRGAPRRAALRPPAARRAAHFKLVFGSGNSDLAKIRPLKNWPPPFPGSHRLSGTSIHHPSRKQCIFNQMISYLYELGDQLLNFNAPKNRIY